MDLTKDGFIYCISINFDNKKVIKIGLTKLLKNDSCNKCKMKLKTRYNTYYPNYDLVYFKRVNNVISAENFIKQKLKKYHLKNELYLYNKRIVKSVFNDLDTHFLNINEHIKTLSTTELTKLNQHLRKK